jgi:hypothetical protein
LSAALAQLEAAARGFDPQAVATKQIGGEDGDVLGRRGAWLSVQDARRDRRLAALP